MADIEGLHELPIDDVIPTADNKRHIDPKSEDMLELAQSIREKGVLQPVLVRPIPIRPGKYDLRAGHRRLVASKLAGRTTIPAIVREMDDRTAAEVTTIENLQREDLSLIEEAEQLQVMIDAGWDVEACALSIGKTLAWVHSRARLARLSPKWKKEVERTSGSSAAWSPAHLELVAQYPHDTQDQIDRTYQHWGRTPSLKELRETIGRLTNELGKAPFDVNDADLVPKAGACLPSCPKRRGHHPDLFLEIGTGDLPLKRDVCLDPKCFEEKVQARLDRMVAEAKTKDDRTVAVTKTPWGSGYRRPGSERYADDFTPAKKTDKGALPAVIVGGGKVGQKTWVKPAKSESGTPRVGPKTLAEKRKQLDQRRLRHANAAMKEAVLKMEAPDEPLSWYGKMIAAGAFERTNGGFCSESIRTTNPLSDAELRERLWKGIQAGLTDRYRGGLFDVDRVSPVGEKNLDALGVELRISWKDLVAAAVVAIPEPKAWAKEAAAVKAAKQNGQAKTAPAKKAKKARRAKTTVTTPGEEAG